MTCPRCNVPNKAGASYCLQCGYRLSSSSSTAGPQLPADRPEPGRGTCFTGRVSSVALWAAHPCELAEFYRELLQGGGHTACVVVGDLEINFRFGPSGGQSTSFYVPDLEAQRAYVEAKGLAWERLGTGDVGVYCDYRDGGYIRDPEGNRVGFDQVQEGWTVAPRLASALAARPELLTSVCALLSPATARSVLDLLERGPVPPWLPPESGPRMMALAELLSITATDD